MGLSKGMFVLQDTLSATSRTRVGPTYHLSLHHWAWLCTRLDDRMPIMSQGIGCVELVYGWATDATDDINGGLSWQVICQDR